MRESLLSQSIRDPLTDLYNRRYFDDVLDAEIRAFLQYGRPLSLLLIDLDHFKRFNDVHGHVAGDDALKALAEVMKNVFRASDVACRYGGEEFGVLLVGTSLDDACRKAESFRKAVEQIQVSSGGRNLGGITATIGVADATGHPDREDLVRAADVALYEGKRAGRNITCTAEGSRTSYSYVRALSATAPSDIAAVRD
jgi:diguanylate cyclase (GGDEF)-like protein